MGESLYGYDVYGADLYSASDKYVYLSAVDSVIVAKGPDEILASGDFLFVRDFSGNSDAIFTADITDWVRYRGLGGDSALVVDVILNAWDRVRLFDGSTDVFVDAVGDAKFSGEVKLDGSADIFVDSSGQLTGDFVLVGQCDVVVDLVGSPEIYIGDFWQNMANPVHVWSDTKVGADSWKNTAEPVKIWSNAQVEGAEWVTVQSGSNQWKTLDANA